MLLKRKQVLCSNCGFLAWLTSYDGKKADKLEECRQYFRDELEADNSEGQIRDYESGELSTMYCIRRQWIFIPHIHGLKGHYTDINQIKQPRRCLYYIKYNPGYNPEEHKELKRQAETKRTILISSLLSGLVGAIIGAAAAIIVQLIST